MHDPVNSDRSPARTRTLRRAAGLAIALVAAGAAGAWLLQGAGTDRSGGRPAADFELPVLGRSGTLSSDDLAEGPVVVNFWASWCVPCKKEMPMFEDVWREHRDDGLQVVGINVQDSEDFALEFLRGRSITYPNVRDVDQAFARSLGVRGLPQTFFLAPGWLLLGDRTTDGVRTGPVVVGEIDRPTLDAHIARLLAED